MTYAMFDAARVVRACEEADHFDRDRIRLIEGEHHAQSLDSEAQQVAWAKTKKAELLRLNSEIAARVEISLLAMGAINASHDRMATVAISVADYRLFAGVL